MLKKIKQKNLELKSKFNKKEAHSSQESQLSKIKFSNQLFRLDQVRI